MSIIKWLSIFTIILLSACNNSDVIPQVAADDDPVILGGKYTGGWTSVTQFTSFSGYPISADLVLSTDETKMNGDFYATNNYTSCCNSGVSDGRIFISLDGDTISSFSLDVVIPNCTGSFYGTGEIKPNGNIIIEITGTDCDGDHVGQLVFTK